MTDEQCTDSQKPQRLIRAIGIFLSAYEKIEEYIWANVWDLTVNDEIQKIFDFINKTDFFTADREIRDAFECSRLYLCKNHPRSPELVQKIIDKSLKFISEISNDIQNITKIIHGINKDGTYSDPKVRAELLEYVYDKAYHKKPLGIDLESLPGFKLLNKYLIHNFSPDFKFLYRALFHKERREYRLNQAALLAKSIDDLNLRKLAGLEQKAPDQIEQNKLFALAQRMDDTVLCNSAGIDKTTSSPQSQKKKISYIFIPQKAESIQKGNTEQEKARLLMEAIEKFVSRYELIEEDLRHFVTHNPDNSTEPLTYHVNILNDESKEWIQLDKEFAIKYPIFVSNAMANNNESVYNTAFLKLFILKFWFFQIVSAANDAKFMLFKLHTDPYLAEIKIKDIIKYANDIVRNFDGIIQILNSTNTYNDKASKLKTYIDDNINIRMQAAARLYRYIDNLGLRKLAGIDQQGEVLQNADSNPKDINGVKDSSKKKDRFSIAGQQWNEAVKGMNGEPKKPEDAYHWLIDNNKYTKDELGNIDTWLRYVREFRKQAEAVRDPQKADFDTLQGMNHAFDNRNS